MKNKFFLFLLLNVFSFHLLYSQDITIGTGTAGNIGTTYPCPFQDFYEGSRAQYLYKASELIAAGMGPGNINSIKFNVTGLNTFSGTIEEFSVKIGGSAVATLSATSWENASTQVYGPLNYVPVTGVNTLTFSSPFFWNGTDNIVLDICNGDANNISSTTWTNNPTVTWTTGLSFNGSHSYRADNLGNLCGTATTTESGTPTTRPNIIFNWTPATACSGTPNAGTATSTSTNILCAGTPITLSLTGSTVASGLTYQWQSSTDNINFSNISGATTFSYTVTQTLPVVYYRAIVTCSGQSSNSASIMVTSSGVPVYTTLPYAESFETTWLNGCNTRDVPNGSWKNTPVTGNNSWRRNDDPAGAAWGSPTLGAYTPASSDGTFSARFHSYQAADGAKGQLDLYVNANTAAAAKRLTFDVINTNGDDTLSILLSTNGGTSFTRLDSVGIATAWRTKSIIFNSTSATCILRFEATSDFGTTDIGLDNLLLIPYADCAGTPAGGTALSSATNVCSEAFTLRFTGASSGNGISYQWQRSVDGGTTWTNIAGATGLTYTTTQVITTQYRLFVTCSFSSASAASTPVQVTSPAAVSGIYSIDNSNPTNIPARTFTSFNDAYNFIKCGINGPVLFNVLTGTGPYNEQLIMNGVPGTSAVNTVTFKGNGVTSIGFASANSNERAVIKLKTARYIIFDSLIINATVGTYGYGVQLISNSDSNIVRNCTINSSVTSTATNFAGIVINGTDAGPVATGVVLCDYNTFFNNTINGGYYGITLVATFAGGASGNNRFIQNQVKDFYQYGMYVSGSYNTLIEKNTFSRPTRTAVGEFHGIYFTTEKNTGDSISKNRFKNPFGGAPTNSANFYGINFNNSDGSVGAENVVSNNLIYNVNGNGPQYGIANTGSDYVYYLHNTISLDDALSASASITRGFSQTTTAGGLFFFDNIVSITRGGAGAKHCIYLGTALIAGADYNDYFINAAAGTNSVGFYTANRPTLTDWKTATGLDAASLSANPAFIDPANENYSPGNAGIDNKGTYVGIDTDINNAVRSTSTPDIGAYEFTPPACSTPPVTGATTLSAVTICQNNPVLLSLLIGPYGSAQTFQWQYSTSASGPFTSIGSPMLTPDTTILASATYYYRAAVTCGGTTVYTTPVLLTVNPSLPAGTYTINKNNPTTYTGPGTGTNFNNFNDAKTAMNCGITGGPVVFNVVPGTGPYNEQLKLDSIKGTSAVNTITFNGLGNTITFNSTNNNERAVIKLSSTDYIIFDSLTIDAGTGSYGYGVQLINRADSNVFRKCTIISPLTATSANFAGIVINASDVGPVTTGNTLCDANVFDRNTITGGYYGVTLVGGTTAATYISNNKFTNNIIKDFYSAGIQVTGTINTLIENNIFTRPVIAATAGTVYGVYAVTAPSNRLMISKNRFTKFFAGVPASAATFYGVYHNSVDATAGSESVISNNLFYDLDGNGPLYALYNISSDNIRYYHNTISIDNTASTSVNAAAGFYQTTLAVGIEFKNNIITISRGGAGLKHAIYLATTTSEVAANNNDYYVTASNSYVGYNGANRLTLADWTAATTLDANSFSVNPLYTDPATGNFKPQLASLDDKGAPVGIATDILNVTRSTTTPDIGAYEFAPVPCQNPPVAGTASVTPNSGICLEAPIILNITGHSPLGTLTFQWQASLNGTTNWVNISPVQYFPQFNTLTSTSTYYRAAVSCGTTTTYTNVVSVTLNNLLLAGTYTINSTQPSSATNYPSFQSAVTALLCGITGPVIFNVAAGDYNEQIRIPYIPGTSNINTVTFQSANGVAGSSNLTFNSTTPAANYTLKLDSTRNFIFKNLTFTATGATYGRVIDLSTTTSSDSILTSNIVAPVVTFTTTNTVGIYANTFKGSNIVIKGNNLSNGSNGIYFAGTSTTSLTSANNLIESNTITGAYNHSIFLQYTNRMKVINNTVTLIPAPAASTAGIYSNYSDTAYRFYGNTININNVTANPVYGMFVQNSRSLMTDSGIISANKIIADNGNTGTVYGMFLGASKAVSAVNNVIAINSAGAVAYGLYNSNNTDQVNYYNNSVNLLTTATNSYAAYFLQSTSGLFDIHNNIFSNKGGGKALFVTNPALLTEDYNTLYTSGTVLVQTGTGTPTTFATLPSWRAASNWDIFSISYPPVFANNLTLQPDIANPDVWAIHGRGVQVQGNNVDINNNPRPVTLLQGVPDMGAYEFFPSSIPTVLSAIPAAPAANTEQTFMYGTDTVMKIKWGTTAPPSIAMRRYSGVVPAGLSTIPLDSMFFYVKADIPGGGNYDYDAQLFYIDPWLGSIPSPYQLGLGKTTASNAWVVGFSSRNDVPKRRIYQFGVNYLDKLTGLVNPYAPPVVPDKDSSNRGRRFWVAYPVNELAGGQEMVLYLSAQEAANVQVKVNGTSWIRNYTVAANTVKVSDLIPKAGADNAFINVAGLSNRGVSITSDVPIVAYAHVYGSASSGASMLLPIGVWGYEYRMLGINQIWGTGGYSYFYAIADNDNTRVEITTPAGIALSNAGITPGTPFTVTLNKGEFYQVVASGTTAELSGSFIKSVPNSQGKCYPIASFSGSSRTQLNTPCGGGGDFIMQQNFPSTAWGKRYLTAPSSASTAANALQANLYRVAVKDPTTIVRRNGVQLTGIINNFYYQFTSSTADFIEADKSIMVAQYLSGACTGVGDPEMMYLSPIEQGINNIGFYRNSNQAITTNYLTMIVPTAALPSLSIIDGATTVIPDFTYPHPQNALSGRNNTVVVKRWTSAQQQVRVQSDSAFTAITYGLGSVESYGYNAGTLVKNLQVSGLITNTLNPTGASTEFTCANSPFRFTITLAIRPVTLTFKFSAVPNLTPNTDVTLNNPLPGDSIYINGTKYYKFTLPQDYIFSTPGVYPVAITYSHPDIEGCDHTNTDLIYVQVIPSPKANFNITFSGCQGDVAQFLADSTTANGILINQWTWNFHDGTTAPGRTASYVYNTPGTFVERLRTLTSDGCIGDSSKPVVVNPRPVVTIAPDSIAVCSGSDTTFTIQNPQTGTIYKWYTTPTGGTPVFTGTSFTITNVTATTPYYVEATSAAGCTSVDRKRVVVAVFQGLTQAIVTAGPPTANAVTFNWNAVPGAASYQVSINNGTFVTPSSGATGLTHTVTGLSTLQSVCIVVKAIGLNSCQTSLSASVCSCNNSAAQVSPDSLAVCSGSSATFNIQNPVAGVSYSWYNVPTGGTAITTGTSFVVPNVTAAAVYYVEQSAAGGCTSTTRTRVVVSVLQALAPAVVTATSSTATSVTFSWSAVAGATSYSVSVNGGAFGTPSSGATGTTHTVTGLTTLQSVSIVVRANGVNSCQSSLSVSVSGCSNSAAVVTPDTLTVCSGTSASFSVQNPVTGITYTWFATQAGGTALFTGVTFVTPAVTSSISYYVQQSSASGCISSTRTKVSVGVLTLLTAPVASVDVAGPNFITFKWNTVAGAVGYQVSTDNGATFITPSSGSTGLTHTVTGLTPSQQVTLLVRAVGNIACQNSVSLPVTGRALLDQVFIPNTFTPNGDGRNDVWLVYGYTIKDMQMMVFNQWGEKIFETTNQANGWDGSYRGKQQPVGVYIYAVKMTMLDGTVVNKRGSINLVR